MQMTLTFKVGPWERGRIEGGAKIMYRDWSGPPGNPGDHEAIRVKCSGVFWPFKRWTWTVYSPFSRDPAGENTVTSREEAMREADDALAALIAEAERPRGRGNCRECKGKLDLLPYTHKERVGRWTVSDSTLAAWVCRKCQTPQLSLDDLQAYQFRAAKTALSAGKLDGAVVTYARKAIGANSETFAAMLSCNIDTVAPWVSGAEPFPPGVAVSLIGVLCRALDGEPPEELVLSRAPDDDPGGELVVHVRPVARAAGAL